MDGAGVGLKRSRPTDTDENLTAITPVFIWSGGSRSLFSARQAASGTSIRLPTLKISADSVSDESKLSALHAIIEGASTPSAPCVLLHTASAPASVERAAWLPPALTVKDVQLVFPGVGLGNRMFLYTLARTAALVLGREFHLLTPHPLFAGVSTSSEPFLGEIFDTIPTTTASTSALWSVRDSRNTRIIPLPLFLSLSARAGSAWVTSQASCGAAGTFVRDAMPLAAEWFSPLMVRCLSSSLRTVREVGAGIDDWVVHVRAGDIWKTPGGGEPGSRGGIINTAYCPPPVSWYTAQATQYHIRRVWLVSGAPDGELVKAVTAALRAGGVEHVYATRGDESADFGTLLRARNLIISCSTFAWWAAVLTPFRPAVYTRTLVGLAAREGTSTEMGAALAAAASEALSVDREIRISVPETGMLRSKSVHAIHADLSIASHAPRAWFDSTALDSSSGALSGGTYVPSASLRVHYFKVWSDQDAIAMDAYTCTPAERIKILEATLPVGSEAGEGVVK